jgi:chromosomal replication initiator protein
MVSIVSSTLAQDTWKAVLGELQMCLPSSTYETYLKDTLGVAIEDNQFVVSVPNAFTAEWLEKRVYHLVHKAVNKISQSPLGVSFLIASSPSPRVPVSQKTSPQSKPATEGLFTANPRYGFNTFVVGPSNSLAYSASEAVALGKTSLYNPLFIYSGVGLGKTHLLLSIARKCLERGVSHLYVTSEHFTNHFISSIRQGKTDDFRTHYRSVDVLLVDDIQFLGGKEQTQEGFFHTFNDLHNSNRQLVMTSDQPPSTMPSMEARLRSRFGWGLIADIQPPPLETRIAILRSKAEQMRVDVSSEVLLHIAERIVENVRDLEGALLRVVATAQTEKSSISPLVADRALLPFLQSSRNVSPALILNAVEAVFNIPRSLLLGRKRDKDIAMARQMAMYFLKRELRMGASEVGRQMGGKNHSTVLYAIKRIASLSNNPEVRAKLQAVKDVILHQSRVA